ncbi:MAG: flavin reductase family protein [Acidimicrobiales bacterium]
MTSEDWITFDPADSDPMSCQLTLSQLIVPRPIAMVSTTSPDGVHNIAPMSYFLPITGDPMLVGISMGLREDGGQKHTYENAMASGDFVINVCSEVFADHIETVALECPPEVDEYELAGFTPIPATKVSSPAIAEAVARLECRVSQVVELGTPGLPFGEVHLVIAEVVWACWSPEILNERGRIDPERLAPIGRLGLRAFVRTVPDGVYSIPRVPWTEYATKAGLETR